MPATPTTRRRAIPPEVPSGGRFRQYAFNGTLQSDSSASVDMAGTQVTVSAGHPFHSRSRESQGDIGGEFFTQKSYIASSLRKYNQFRMKNWPNGDPISSGRYEGIILPYFPSVAGNANKMAYPPALNSSDAALDKLGATAISRCAPGNPPSNVVTFLGELLKDGLPSLVGSQTWKAKSRVAKAAGNDYLNAQFGWLPMISDIQSLAHTMTHADAVLRQFERDAGKVVRRRYRFPSTKEVTEDIMATGAAAKLFPSTSYFTDTFEGKVTRTREIVRHQWFSGAFTYYIPDDYDSRRGLAKLAQDARTLYGISLTPDTIWELSPWSWAVDWFSNTGDVIHNVSRFANNGLVMRYGYMMEHTIVTDTYSIDKHGIISTPYLNLPPLKLVTETKIRRQANPFGFGLTWDGLSSFQASILAALGITRSR